MRPFPIHLRFKLINDGTDQCKMPLIDHQLPAQLLEPNSCLCRFVNWNRRRFLKFIFALPSRALVFRVSLLDRAQLVIFLVFFFFFREVQRLFYATEDWSQQQDALHLPEGCVTNFHVVHFFGAFPRKSTSTDHFKINGILHGLLLVCIILKSL